MTVAARDHTHDLVIAGVGLPGFDQAVRQVGLSDVLTLAEDEEIATLNFGDAADTWRATLTDGTVHRARLVVLGSGAASAGASSEGRRRYLNLATNGVPNLFVLAGEDVGIWRRGFRRTVVEVQQSYVLRLLEEMHRRESTRVEVRPHIQADYDRRWGLAADRPERSFRARTRRPTLSDFAFTTAEDRAEEDEDLYDGPATLTFADGAELTVRARVIAQYEPVANTIHGRGRVARTDELRARHTDVYQPVTLQVGDRPAVAAHLVDEDPWGGSTIIGSGASPYETPVEAEYAVLFAGTEGATAS